MCSILKISSTCYAPKRLGKSTDAKAVLMNVDEIDPRSQFHQHYTLDFLVQKFFFVQLFFSYSLAL